MDPEFRRPATVDEALGELRQEGAVAVGGGTQVALLTRHGLLAPTRLVWLGAVAGLRDISSGDAAEAAEGGAAGEGLGPAAATRGPREIAVPGSPQNRGGGVRILRGGVAGCGFRGVGRGADAPLGTGEVGPLLIGAGVTLAGIAASPVVRGWYPALAGAAAGVGNARVRAVATLGGHLVHADPRQDLPPVLLALDAVAEVRRPGEQRDVALRDLFVGPFETALREDELLTAVRVPAPAAGARLRYERFAPGSENDYPTVGVAACLETHDGAIRRAVVGLAGVGARPLRLELAQLRGQPAGREAWEAAGEAVAAACEPATDQRGSATYKRAMARLWTARALAAAAAA